MKIIASFLIVITIAATLLNSNAFGSPTLIAWFGYSILTCVLGTIILWVLIQKEYSGVYKIPSYVLVFIFLSLYVFADGLLRKAIGFTNLYWAVNCIFLLSASVWASKLKGSAAINKVHWSIVILSVTESVIVLLQCIRLFPAPTDLFLCTGTWINPNVTAMFLSLSLFSLFIIAGSTKTKPVKLVCKICLFLIIGAIVMLQCRSAYLAAATLILFEYGYSFRNYLKANLRFTLKGVAITVSAIMVVQILFSVFTSKQASTQSRLQIWGGSISLLKDEPIFGYGFGLFEKFYNLSAAEKENPVNDHVNMAYNDFIEIAFEGGVIGFFLWILFLFEVWRKCCKRNFSNRFFPLLLAFFLIQLTNFGFQAIPAMVLFLFYVGSSSNQNPVLSISVGKLQKNRTVNYFTGAAGVLTSALLLIHIANLTSAFYKKWMITTGSFNSNYSIQQLGELKSKLDNFSSYHESAGDTYMKEKKLRPALNEYLKALESRSEPDLFLKSGFCYQAGLLYDSSEYYYTVVKKMQPHKLIPRFYLLKLYQQKNDSVLASEMAIEIINLPVKVRNRKAIEIKKYAKLVKDSFK